MSNPRTIKGVIEKVVVLREGTPGLNFNGGSYNELQYILRGEDGKRYVSFTTSAEFDFCSLWGYYTDCTSCSWWWERWLPCEDCDRRRDCQECIADFYPCQNPDLVLIETEQRIFRAQLLEEDN